MKDPKNKSKKKPLRKGKLPAKGDITRKRSATDEVSKKVRKQRVDKDRNIKSIRDAIYEYVVTNKGKAPTMTDLAEATGLSYKTIERRYKDIEFRPTESYFKLLTPDIIIAVANAAKKGRGASQKLWFQLVEGWAERSELTGAGGESLFSGMAEKDKKDLVNRIKNADK